MNEVGTLGGIMSAKAGIFSLEKCHKFGLRAHLEFEGLYNVKTTHIPSLRLFYPHSTLSQAAVHALRPVLQCLGHVRRLDMFTPRQVRDGVRELQDTVVGAGGEVQLAHAQHNVAARMMLSLTDCKFVVVNARDFDPQKTLGTMCRLCRIDAVEQGAGDTLPSVHEGRPYKKLQPFVPLHRTLLDAFLKRFWDYYHKLQDYKENPSHAEQSRLESAFDDLFSTQTGYALLDKQIVKSRAKKASLLLILKHPELPLHNNASELAVRRRVRKRDVSFGPRTENGRKAWDTFMTLAETTRKLGISFYVYLCDRISDRHTTPPLADLVMFAAGQPVSTQVCSAPSY